MQVCIFVGLTNLILAAAILVVFLLMLPLDAIHALVRKSVVVHAKKAFRR